MQVDKKTFVTAAVLLAVIVAVGIVALRRAGLIGGVRLPNWVLDQPVEMVDSTTLELMTETRRQWDNLGQDGRGYFKSPKTGKFTMMPPTLCAACGQKIPSPEVTKEMKENPDEMMKVMRNYKCPKCGKLVFGALPPPPPRSSK